MSAPLLPVAFAILEPFVGEWVLEDCQARTEKRHATSFEALRAFYDAALEAAPSALAYLDERRLGELDASEERLLKLMLAFAEVIPAIEFYGQPAVLDGFPPEKFRIDDTLSDLAPQE